MANAKHLSLLQQGVQEWNRWKKRNRAIRPDLKEADLRDLDLSGADLGYADLTAANLTYAFLTDANLRHARLAGAKLVETNFVRADLRHADLANVVVNGANFRDANIHGASLTHANLGASSFIATDLSKANLSNSDLSYSRFIDTNLTGTNLTNCRVYGVSAWGLNLTRAVQHDLIITREAEHRITVDNLEVAQFVYLLLNNPKVREVIDTITSKVVLILGRFTPGRKPVLDALRDALRKHNYSPILFDFEKSASRDLTETVSVLAHMARFIVADITDAKSIPQELGRIVPGLPSVPVQPLLEKSAAEYSMFEHFQRYPWVLPVHRYGDIKGLLASLEKKVIAPAETQVKAQRPR